MGAKSKYNVSIILHSKTQDVTSLFVDRNLNGCQNYSLTPLIFFGHKRYRKPIDKSLYRSIKRSLQVNCHLKTEV